MGKLKTLKPRLSPAPVRLSRATDERALDRRRLADTETRRLHKTARWQELRWSVLARDEFTCQNCGRLEGDTSKLVCDHVEPHQLAPSVKWTSGSPPTLTSAICGQAP